MKRLKWTLPAILVPLLLLLLPLQAACDQTEGGSPDGATTSSSAAEGPETGDVKGTLGEDIEVGSAVITLRALQSTFQPVMPPQRLSEGALAAPGPGESFYQAYVRVRNTKETPLRVDPRDFACRIGETVVSIEPTRSGPYARSLLKNTSLDLLLTFKGPAGYQAVLLYNPPWHGGVISIGPEVEEEPESTTTS